MAGSAAAPAAPAPASPSRRGRIVLEAREALAELFGVENPFRIVFTKNATEALNLALRVLEKKGVEVSVLPCSIRGELDPGTIRPAVRRNTKALVLTHAANVTGTILPITQAGRIAHERDRPHRRCGADCRGPADPRERNGNRPHGIHGPQIPLRSAGDGRALYPAGAGGKYPPP